MSHVFLDSLYVQKQNVLFSNFTFALINKLCHSVHRLCILGPICLVSYKTLRETVYMQCIVNAIIFNADVFFFSVSLSELFIGVFMKQSLICL